MDDEDTYGFGSFSDLFDAGPAAAKRLDMSALSRFCMSERLLSRFQQQRDERGVTFQHVAAKFDGVGVDGGLGALTLTTLERGGVVWLQTPQSDSDALERRKKELQDITNRGPALDGAKSAAALFVALHNVAKVQPMTVQNTVQGVKMQLRGGHRLELTFMPGPFADATHRDEFLTALKLLDAEKETQEKEKEVVQTPGRRHRAVAAKEKTPRKVAEQREKFRQLVRRYTTMDPLSEEGLAIAQQVQAETGYYLGPTTKQMPQFSADAEYRKKTVEELSGFLQRMNQEWSEADSRRQLHTKARHSRNDDDLFEYTDTDTGAQIPPRVYEQRYLEYVKAHEVNPVLRMFPGSKKETTSNKSVQNGTTSSAERWTSDESVSSVESTSRIISLFTTTLGVDISSSCIIGKDFFSAENTQALADPPTHRAEDKVFRAAVDKARMKVWDSWGSAFAQISGNRATQSEFQRDHSTSHAQLTASVTGHSSSRKRARERRRSLVLPTADDLQATAQTVASTSSQAVNGTLSNGGDVHQPRSKRSRSSSDTVPKSQRKARRQSIVSTVHLPVVANTDESKKAIDKRRTPQSTKKSPRSRHPANSYSRATSALEMVGDEDSDLCQLCYVITLYVFHVVGVSSSTLLFFTYGFKNEQEARGWTFQRVAAVTPSQASAIATRLLHWKKLNEAKREVKARLQEDSRIEEEESFHLLHKTLPQSQVQVAAVRNYRAADELRWKKLLLQAVAKQQQLDEEKIECTFRPHLVTRSRGSVLPTQPKLRTCRSSCATVTNSSAQQPSHRHGRSTSKTDENVFERLYKPQAQVSAVTDSQTDQSPVPKRISSQTEATFIIRQERDLIVRQRRRSERAFQQRFPHKPKLSRHTQEICAALRGRGTDNPVQQATAYGMKRDNSHVRYVYTVPASSMPDSHCKQVSVALAPFSSVIKALRQQEQQMRCISKCA